jgi:hypothetical protein
MKHSYQIYKFDYVILDSSVLIYHHKNMPVILTSEDKFIAGVFCYPNHSQDDWKTFLINYIGISEELADYLTEGPLVICSEGNLFLNAIGNQAVLNMKTRFHMEDDTFPKKIFSRSYLKARDLIGNFFTNNPDGGSLKDMKDTSYLPPYSTTFREALNRLIMEGDLQAITMMKGEKFYTLTAPKKIKIYLGKEAEIVPLNPDVLGHWFLLFSSDMWTLRTEVTRGKSSSELASSSSSTSTSCSSSTPLLLNYGTKIKPDGPLQHASQTSNANLTELGIITSNILVLEENIKSINFNIVSMEAKYHLTKNNCQHYCLRILEELKIPHDIKPSI